MDRETGENSLKDSEERYRRLFETAKDGILILDADSGRIVDVNPFLLDLTGYDFKDFVGKQLWEIGPFRNKADAKAALAELKSKKYIRYDDLPLEARDGRELAVEFVSNVYRVGDHDVIQCNIRDITARKRAEDALRFRDLILSTQQEASLDGIVVVDAHNKIISSNSRFSEMWGISLEAMESKSYERVLQVMAEKILYPVKIIGDAKSLSLDPGIKSRDEIVLNDGRIFDYYSSAMISAEGQDFGRVWFFMDISVRKGAEVEQKNLEAQLRGTKKMEAIGSLAGGVAHDFNNLLTVILSYTDFAMGQAIPGSPLMNDLQEVMKAARRASELTRQLLAFGRKQILQPIPLNLNQVIVGVEKMLRRIVGEDIKIDIALAPDIGIVLADPGQIEQVLMNLVVNAREAMPQGGRLTIETGNIVLDADYVKSHLDGDSGTFVQLAVTDTGCGMDAATQAKLFEPFFTTKALGIGTGLGLSTAYGIVKQSGGNIIVYSELGKGTTFKVYLPWDLTVIAPVVSKPTIGTKIFVGTETILVVDDEKAIREVAGRMLAKAGYKVMTAEDGVDAIRASGEYSGEIDLLLTDVVMPKMGGNELAQELLNNRPALKVLFMSGYPNNAMGHHGVLDAGLQFIGKPFSAVELTQKIRDVLKMKVGLLLEKQKP
jgi:PAS domain S-box-containing protein